MCARVTVTQRTRMHGKVEHRLVAAYHPVLKVAGARREVSPYCIVEALGQHGEPLRCANDGAILRERERDEGKERERGWDRLR